MGEKRHNTSHSGAGSTREHQLKIFAIEKRIQIFVDGGIRTRDLLHGKRARYHWTNRARYILVLWPLTCLTTNQYVPTTSALAMALPNRKFIDHPSTTCAYTKQFSQVC
ncbi:hypothetical protein M8J77_016493 [Diaphorina citri]|nr:hypothetical protein M8J77_016493 [Diaphorina citri]